MKVFSVLLFIGFWSLTSAAFEVQGHRGARARLPENSLPAFRYALENNVDTLELDLNVTRDDVLVIAHDPVVNPVICRGPGGKPVPEGLAIRSLLWEELKKYDCASIKNPRFPEQEVKPGTPIARLEDLLQFIKDSPHPNAKKVQFNIETKMFPAHPEVSPEPKVFVSLLLKVLNQYDVVARTTLQSFDDRTLKEAFKQERKLRRVQLTSENHVNLVAVAKFSKAWAISPNHEWLLPEDVVALHKAGIKVIPWTANKPQDWERLINMGVDGIITDDPVKLIEFIGQAKRVRKAQ